MYAISAAVQPANYYTPVQHSGKTSSYQKACTSISPRRRTTHILGRRYSLTKTAQKYLEIGLAVENIPAIEVVIGDNKGSRLTISYATWRALMQQKEQVQQFLHADKSQPLWIEDLSMKHHDMQGLKIVKLTIHSDVVFTKPDTITTLYKYEDCIDHMHAYLCEIIHDVTTKMQNFISIIRERRITDVHHAANVIRNSPCYNCESLIDSELLACALDDMLYQANTP